MTIRNLLVLLLLFAASGMTCAAAETAATSDLPPPIEAIRMQGVQIVGTFDVPGELTGYAGIMGQRSVAIYLTADKQRAIVGYMIDGAGNFVDRDTVQQMTAGPMSQHIWSQLENSSWVAEGDADAPRIVYEFTDPNCPYCHVFWKRAQPWIDAGKIEVRHVMVGVISQTSPNKAAAILAAEDPTAAFIENQQQFAAGGIAPMQQISAEIGSKIMANQRLMAQLGIRGTPGLVYRDDNGRVQIWPGVPPEDKMAEVLGPAPQ